MKAATKIILFFLCLCVFINCMCPANSYTMFEDEFTTSFVTSGYSSSEVYEPTGFEDIYVRDARFVYSNPWMDVEGTSYGLRCGTGTPEDFAWNIFQTTDTIGGETFDTYALNVSEGSYFRLWNRTQNEGARFWFTNFTYQVCANPLNVTVEFDVRLYGAGSSTRLLSVYVFEYETVGNVIVLDSTDTTILDMPYDVGSECSVLTIYLNETTDYNFVSIWNGDEEFIDYWDSELILQYFGFSYHSNYLTTHFRTNETVVFAEGCSAYIPWKVCSLSDYELLETTHYGPDYSNITSEDFEKTDIYTSVISVGAMELENQVYSLEKDSVFKNESVLAIQDVNGVYKFAPAITVSSSSPDYVVLSPEFSYECDNNWTITAWFNLTAGCEVYLYTELLYVEMKLSAGYLQLIAHTNTTQTITADYLYDGRAVNMFLSYAPETSEIFYGALMGDVYVFSFLDNPYVFDWTDECYLMMYVPGGTNENVTYSLAAQYDNFIDDVVGYEIFSYMNETKYTTELVGNKYFRNPSWREESLSLSLNLTCDSPHSGDIPAYYSYYAIVSEIEMDSYCIAVTSPPNVSVTVIGYSKYMYSNFNSTQMDTDYIGTYISYFFPYLYQINESFITLYFVLERTVLMGETSEHEFGAIFPSITITFQIYALELEYESFDFLQQVFGIIAPLLLATIFPILFYSYSRKPLWGAIGFVIGAVILLIAGEISPGGGLLMVFFGGILLLYLAKREKSQKGELFPFD